MLKGSFLSGLVIPHDIHKGVTVSQATQLENGRAGI